MAGKPYGHMQSGYYYDVRLPDGYTITYWHDYKTGFDAAAFLYPLMNLEEMQTHIAELQTRIDAQGSTDNDNEH